LDTPQRRAERLLGALRPTDETLKSSPELERGADELTPSFEALLT
jgi:hypothetical protein